MGLYPGRHDCILQRLKPENDFAGLCGTTEVMP
jgi:hypothetical protein